MNLNGTTILTYADIRTISSGFTVYDVPGNFCLFRGRGILFKVCRIKTQKDILYCGFIMTSTFFPVKRALDSYQGFVADMKINLRGFRVTVVQAVPEYSAVLRPAPSNVLQSCAGGSVELLLPEVQPQIQHGASPVPEY